jgi:hypothetical protein
VKAITGNSINWKEGDKVKYQFDTGEILNGYVDNIRVIPGFTCRMARATLKFYNSPYRRVEGCPDTLIHSVIV